jgi:hypothetical protein
MIKDMQKDLRLVREVLQNSFQFPASELADKRFSDAIKLIGDGGAAKGTQAMSTAYGINQKI